MTIHRVELRAGVQRATVELTGDAMQVVARIGDVTCTLRVEPLGDGVLLVTSGKTRRVVRHAAAGGRHWIHLDGRHFAFEVGPAPDAHASGHHHDLAAPMSGVVTRVFVEEGQAVRDGDPLFVVEAMKMEHVVRAPSAGRVTRVMRSSGAHVDGGAIVVEVEPVVG